MKEILAVVMRRKKRFSTLPLFAHLKDEKVSPRQRLLFLPYMAHFIMSFGDLNRLVLRYPHPSNELEHMVNTHAEEDSHHWPWFLEDLSALGMDGASPFTAHLQGLWSPALDACRLLTYRLVQLAQDPRATLRLALIEMMEETGNVMFQHLADIETELEKREGLRLRFCGSHHLDRETGHAMGSDHRVFARIALSEEETAQHVAVVEQAADHFDAFIDTLYYQVR
jgi:hypothetical protein